jgi:nucleotide-binding universal stress UspA family protein
VALGGVRVRAEHDHVGSLALCERRQTLWRRTIGHDMQADGTGETLVQREAEELLERAAGLFAGAGTGEQSVGRHVVTDRSTPEGLRALADLQGADVIVFCSDSHTAHGHIGVGNSAERLLDRGRTAIAIAPVGLADAADPHLERIVAVGEAEGGAAATAESLAEALGATVAPVANHDADLLVVDSRAEAEHGQVSISSSAAHLIEIATCSVLVVPRGVSLHFDTTAAALSA